MATNLLGSGTRNIVFNAPIDWKAELGRAAYQAGISLGQFVRDCVEHAAAQKNPALAERLKAARRQYYGAAMLTLFLFTIFSHDVVRRPLARRCREAGEIAIEEVEA